MRTLRGLSTARGFAFGPVFVYRGDGDIPVPEYTLAPEAVDGEIARLREAVSTAHRDLEDLVATLNNRGGRADAKVFECHLMILDDPVFAQTIEGRIRTDRLNAEAAVRRSTDQARDLFAKMNDAYLRERVRDLDDVERRVLRLLMGAAASPVAGLKTPSVIVADDLTPSETVQLPRSLILGFATNGGSTTSHVALLARSMGIPAVSGLGNVTSLAEPGETVLLDGTEGCITLSPDAAALRDFRDLVERQKELSEEATELLSPGRLKDGETVSLYANLHPGAPFEGVKGLGAQGVGLYRSEYLWLNEQGEPSEEDQFKAYREVAEFAATLSEKGSVTIRVLDIGGDKLVQGISQRPGTRQSEANPFLGNRSIRYLLSNTAVFKSQLRAILRASAYGRVNLLYPMISCVEELRSCAVLLNEVRRDLDAEGVPYDKTLRVGVMIEVPSAALNVAALVPYVDFLSIGTNDLIQYTLAADRGNKAVAYLYQPTNPAILELMHRVVETAKKNHLPVSVCGESAADPIVGILWVAFGVTILSMSATYIPVLAKLLSKLTRADLDDYLRTVLAAGSDKTGDEILEICRDWMHGKIPDLDNIAI